MVTPFWNPDCQQRRAALRRIRGEADGWGSTNEELSPKPQRPRGGVTLLEKNEKKRRILRLKIVQNAPK